MIIMFLINRCEEKMDKTTPNNNTPFEEVFNNTDTSAQTKAIINTLSPLFTAIVGDVKVDKNADKAALKEELDRDLVALKSILPTNANLTEIISTLSRNRTHSVQTITNLIKAIVRYSAA